MNLRVLCLMLVGVLASCGGNVKNQQCTGVDWDQHGYETAKAGKSPRDFNRYRDGCGDKLEAGATDTYLDGYTRGLVEFCTYENGYARGFSNKSMDNACPVEMRSKYERGYKVGLLELKEKINMLKLRNENAEHEDAVDRSNSGATPQ